jgi:hypothetical protein
MMECEGEASEGEVVEVAEAGICGMIEALNDKGDGFSSDVHDQRGDAHTFSVGCVEPGALDVGGARS